MSLTHCMVVVVTVTVYWGRSVCALLCFIMCGSDLSENVESLDICIRW